MAYYRKQLTLGTLYGILPSDQSDFIGEDMCPRDYNINVNTDFWGACLCWENGGRRSKNGKNATCVAELPVQSATSEDTGETTHAMDKMCYSVNEAQEGKYDYAQSDGQSAKYNDWCTQYTNSNGQVCPYDYYQKNNPETDETECHKDNMSEDEKSALQLLPETVK
jgi:hypothetical protein